MLIFNKKTIILSLILGIGVLFGGINYSFADAGTPGVISFKNPLAYDTVDELLLNLLERLQGIIVIIAIIFIIIGALLYMTSAGNEGRMTMAKAAIAASMIGLAVGVAAPSFLKEIYLALGKTTTASQVNGALTLAEIAYNILNFLLSVVGVVAIIMLVASGIMYLTAAGNEAQIETAKKGTKWAIIGTAVAIGSLIIVKQIAKFFGT